MTDYSIFVGEKGHVITLDVRSTISSTSCVIPVTTRFATLRSAKLVVTGMTNSVEDIVLLTSKV